MKTILGIVKPAKGDVLWEGEVINNLRTAERIKRGIATVPENRRLFPHLTVLENLEMGAYTRTDAAEIAEDLERVYEFFPEARPSAASSAPARSPAASSRWWRSGAR